jgi:hypothetical protein
MKKMVWFLGIVSLLGLLAACPQPTGDDNGEGGGESETAKKNKELYESLFVGKWQQYDIINTITYEVMPELIMEGQIEFKKDSFALPADLFPDPEGKYVVGNKLYVNEIDFETLFAHPLLTEENKDKQYTSVTTYYEQYGNNFGRAVNKRGYIVIYPEKTDKKIYATYGITFLRENLIYFQQGETKNGSNSPVGGYYGARYFQRIEGTGTGNDVALAGDYTVTQGGYTHSLSFKSDGTYQLINSASAANNRTGTWSISGNTLTMSYNTGATGEEQFTVVDNGSTVTLTLKGDSAVSLVILSLISSTSTSMTINKN